MLDRLRCCTSYPHNIRCWTCKFQTNLSMQCIFAYCCYLPSKQHRRSIESHWYNCPLTICTLMPHWYLMRSLTNQMMSQRMKIQTRRRWRLKMRKWRNRNHLTWQWQRSHRCSKIDQVRCSEPLCQLHCYCFCCKLVPPSSCRCCSWKHCISYCWYPALQPNECPSSQELQLSPC